MHTQPFRLSAVVPRLRLVGAILAGAVGMTALAAAAPSPPGRTQAGDARQKALYVSVVDRDGAPVADIAPDDLIVREDGVAREVLRVEPATDPMQVALLVDNSQAATRAVQYLRDAIGPFVDTLTAKGHAVSFVTLGDRPTLVVNATTDAATLKKKGADRLFAQPGAGMYLLEALIETTRGFEKNEAPRPVIVSVTTEGTEFSNQSYDSVIEALKKSRASYYALVLTEGVEARADSDEVRHRNVVLDRGTRETGGHREIVISDMAVNRALSKIATELVSQLKVTYASPERLIPADKIAIAAKRTGLTARGVPAKAAAR